MSEPIRVEIIGAPIACKEGIKDSWREVAEWAAGQLKAFFGDAIEVEYYDLLDTNCPPIPAYAQLPLVLVKGEVLTNGVKISIPIIRRRLQELDCSTR